MKLKSVIAKGLNLVEKKNKNRQHRLQKARLFSSGPE